MKRIQLTQGKFALIDDDDYSLVSKYTWCCHKFPKKNVSNTYYAATNIRINGKYKTIHMHRLITNVLPGMEIDHKNHNGLDNRRFNLLICTKSENAFNRRKQYGKSSKYLGVSRHQCGKWSAYYGLVHLGYFNSEIEAFNVRTVYSNQHR